MYEIPFIPSVALSMFTIIVIINAFNLIDGINGLSGSITVLITLTIGIWFYWLADSRSRYWHFSLAASRHLLSYITMWHRPASLWEIQGALLNGLVCSILTIKFIELNRGLTNSPYSLKAVPAVAVGIFDFAIVWYLARVYDEDCPGRSPLVADRNHIHHLLIDADYLICRRQVYWFASTHCLSLWFYIFKNIGTFNLLVLILGIASLLSGMLFLIAKKGDWSPDGRRERWKKPVHSPGSYFSKIDGIAFLT